VQVAANGSVLHATCTCARPGYTTGPRYPVDDKPMSSAHRVNGDDWVSAAKQPYRNEFGTPPVFCAALDVFNEEPLPSGHPFYKLENVLLSAHCADHTPDWMDLAMRFFLDQFERFRKGEPLMNVVNKSLGY